LRIAHNTSNARLRQDVEYHSKSYSGARAIGPVENWEAEFAETLRVSTRCEMTGREQLDEIAVLEMEFPMVQLASMQVLSELTSLPFRIMLVQKLNKLTDSVGVL
jgi:hypothetical protein